MAITASRTRLHRAIIILGLGLYGALRAALSSAGSAGLSDFGLVWAAARCLVHGLNPYALIGPDRAIAFQFHLNYPLPAVVAMLPFAALSAHVADALFLGLGTAALAWGLTRHGADNPQLALFASYGFFSAADNVQWSPLMLASALVPALGFLIAAKPTIGLALWAAFPSRRTLISGAVLGLVTTALWPWWIPGWLDVIRQQPHLLAPVTLVSAGGPLVLLALLKWRRPEARLLVALACIPHSVVLYETVALFLLVETWTEGIVLAGLTWVLFHLQPAYAGGDFTAWITAGARWQVLLVYLPCLLMVLRRPNVWPERASSRGGPGPDNESAARTHRATDGSLRQRSAPHFFFGGRSLPAALRFFPIRSSFLSSR